MTSTVHCDNANRKTISQHTCSSSCIGRPWHLWLCCNWNWEDGRLPATNIGEAVVPLQGRKHHPCPSDGAHPWAWSPSVSGFQAALSGLATNALIILCLLLVNNDPSLGVGRYCSPRFLPATSLSQHWTLEWLLELTLQPYRALKFAFCVASGTTEI